MKIKNLIAAAAFSALAFVGAAQSATIDLGTVAIGDSGQLNKTGATGLYDTLITGTLPNNSEITFTYTYTKGFSPIALSSEGDYSFHNRTTKFDGISTSTASPTSSTTSSSATTNPVGSNVLTPSNSLVLTTANLGTTSATSTISNTSIGTANFVALLIGFLNSGKVIVTYAVTALSNVPLPSSAILFMLGMLGFASYGLLNRKQRIA